MAASKNQQSTPHVTHRNVPPELYPSPLTESNRLGKTSVALEPFLNDEANPPSILTPHRKHDSQGTIETTQSSSFNQFANILNCSLFDIPDGFRQAARSHREEAYVRTKITPCLLVADRFKSTETPRHEFLCFRWPSCYSE